jgi:hypothetical protein
MSRKLIDAELEALKRIANFDLLEPSEVQKTPGYFWNGGQVFASCRDCKRDIQAFMLPSNLKESNYLRLPMHRKTVGGWCTNSGVQEGVTIPVFSKPCKACGHLVHPGVGMHSYIIYYRYPEGVGDCSGE